MTEEEAREVRNWFGAMLNEARTGLFAVMGFSDILLAEETGALNEFQRELAEGISMNSHKSAGILSRYKLYVDLKYGDRDSEPEWEALSLRGMVEKVVGAIHTYNPRLDLTLDMPAEMPKVRAEASALQSLLGSLLDTDLHNNSPVDIRVRVEATSVLVEITVQAHVPEYFVRKPYIPGTPLASAELLLHQLESELVVRPQPNSTLFSFKLPISSEAADATEGKP